MNARDVKPVFERGVKDRILKSDGPRCNIDEVQQRVQRWKDEGFTVVFTAGVFDIFTLNHLLGLYHYKLLGGTRTKLIVSVDTDERVRTTKAYNDSKGGSIKPVLSWQNRALMIAKQATHQGEALVDLILQHGSDTCGGVCPHDDNVSIAEMVHPDLVVVTSTSTETIEKLTQGGVIPRESIVIIDEEELSYSDELLGGKISNTAIIRRIKHDSQH